MCPTRAKNLEWYLILGGQVKSMIEKWETSQKTDKFTQNSATGFSENGNSDGPLTKIKEGKREERRGGRGGQGRDNNIAANGHEGSEEPPQDNKGKVTCIQGMAYIVTIIFISKL